MPGPAGPAGEDTGGIALADLIGAGDAQRFPLLVTYVRQRSAAAAGLPARTVSAHQPFTALGLDSLRLLQLKQRIETELGVAVPLEHFMDYPTATAFAVPVLEALDHNVQVAWAEVAGLTDDEVDTRLAELTAKGPPAGGAASVPARQARRTTDLHSHF